MQNAKGSRRERELLRFLAKKGYVVHRVAGSGVHDTAICDLVAMKNGKCQFIEVKSRKKVFYSKQHLEQFDLLIKASKKAGAKPILALKLNYKPWEFFDLSEKIPEKIS